MSFRTREVCEICEEQIKSNEATLEMLTGVARKRGFWRTVLGLFNTSNIRAAAHIHVDCLLYNGYNYEEPLISMRRIVDKLVREEESDE